MSPATNLLHQISSCSSYAIASVAKCRAAEAAASSASESTFEIERLIAPNKIAG